MLWNVIQDLWARMHLGWPSLGRITSHPEDSYEHGQACEAVERIQATFGDLSRLTCLDLGAGSGDSAIARQIHEVPWRRLISVEVFMPHISRLRQKDVRAERHDIHQCRIQEVFDELVAREADVALLINVLEHMPRRDGLRLLMRLEEFVGRGVVIFWPIGKVRNISTEGNALEQPRSAWKPHQLARLCYDVDVYEGYTHSDRRSLAGAWALKSWNR
mgnify:FL=1